MSFKVQERTAIIACLGGVYQPSGRLRREKMPRRPFKRYARSAVRLGWHVLTVFWRLIGRTAFGESNYMMLK
ncbi:hypothetical protein [uncultured Pseudomonas sp.]|uniref:hypothetical protein n=1 Tax=uncultured Pseudomonas sp. TaxID=114707 RepID=UPI00261DAAA5|nr:hypothetical protein [uncultured Pseudomonas sp.]